MPNYAHVKAEILCPSCGSPANNLLTPNLAWFQWGFCRAATPWSDFEYEIGDPIRWKACEDGITHPWTYFMEGPHSVGANIGDPKYQNLIVRDPAQFQWAYRTEDDPERRPSTCDSCGHPLAGIAVEIRNGFIANVWIHSLDEFDSRTYFYLVDSNGVRYPKPEWEHNP